MQPPSMPTTRLLFDSGIVYVIPNYQRAYVWNQTDQWEPLWEDIEKIVNPMLASSEAGNPNPPAPHFLGAAVLKSTAGGAVQNAKRYTVVDGQQRLTTLQLLLAAVADVFHGYESLAELEEFARQMTVNFVSGRPSEAEPNKILPLGGDFQLFSALMENSRSHASSSHISGTVAGCYQFFLNQVAAWLTEGQSSGQTVERRANALLAVISDYLQVVAIYLEPWENEAAIFESLNARSEPLSEWEKIKNHIIYKASNISGVDASEWYTRYLMGLDDPEWRKETGQGAASRRLSDQFLDYWLESKLKQQIDTRRIYREFRLALDKEENSVDLGTWCADLKTDSRYFLKWQKPPEESADDVEAVFHSRRIALNIGAIWPFLLALSRTEMTPADKNRCLRALDSYLWRRSLVGSTTRPIDTLALGLVGVLSCSPVGEFPYSTAVINHLQDRSEAQRLHWPKDDAVRKAILEGRLKDKTVWKVLEAVERAIMRGKYPGNEKMLIARPIEHLMPQTRTAANWPLPDDAAEDAEEQREAAIHRLGNLTLVQPGLNSILSNKPWVEKRRILAEQDNLYINKDLLNHAPDDHWDEEQIRLRGERLVDYILQIWPHGQAVTGEIERIQN